MPDRILVTVKTYPTLSKQYGETVCTAGLREDGTWVRIYPVAFRRLDEAQQYEKYDWIECTLVRSSKDHRPETHHPTDPKAIRTVGHIDTKDEWSDRRAVVLKKTKVYDDLDVLIVGARQNTMSLAVFKPNQIIDFVVEACDRQWDPKKLEAMRAEHAQLDMFDDRSWAQTFQVIPKLPYAFSYRFQDSKGRTSELQILDWEIGQLYWNCLRGSNGDENAAIAKVRQKYMDEFLQKDLHFYLGTTQEYHQRAPNPWVIIGVLPIPHERQQRLF